MTEENQIDQNEATEQVVPSLDIQRIYVKDISFEAPNTPVIFQQDWKPQLSFDLNTQTTELAENVYEVCLNLSIETKLEDSGDVAFLCEVKQAGIFTVTGLEGVQLAHCLGAQCPTILFPYARELVASLVNKGTFPALNLSPINFDALFMQQLQQQEQVQENSDNESESSENEQVH